MPESAGLGSSPPAFSRVGVLGLGLLGGSVALRLSETAGVTVAGCDPDLRTRELAAVHGIAAHGEPGAWLGDCDLVVVATPLDLMEPVLAAALPRLAGDALVIDVGSVKEPVHDLLERLGAAERFVGCHPMAGTEQAGFAHASADLVSEVVWAVTLRPEASDPMLEEAARVTRFLVATFGARVSVLPPRVHDQAVAVISQLPHLLANLLLDSAGTSEFREVAAQLAAGSFRDGTRVAGTNPTRTFNMIRANRVGVATELRHLSDRLGGLLDALDDESGSLDDVRDFLESVHDRADLVRDPACVQIPIAEIDTMRLRSLLASPERAHAIG